MLDEYFYLESESAVSDHSESDDEDCNNRATLEIQLLTQYVAANDNAN